MTPASPATPQITIAELSARLIAVFEGLRLTAYRDTGGVWTIGFGHTAKVFSGQTITAEQAENFLAEDMAPLFNMVKDRPLLEAAALVSFGYNCGSAALLRLISGYSIGTDDQGMPAILQYDKDRRGNVLPGLMMRRQLEHALILASRETSQK